MCTAFWSHRPNKNVSSGCLKRLHDNSGRLFQTRGVEVQRHWRLCLRSWSTSDWRDVYESQSNVDFLCMCMMIIIIMIIILMKYCTAPCSQIYEEARTAVHRLWANWCLIRCYVSLISSGRFAHLEVSGQWWTTIKKDKIAINTKKVNTTNCKHQNTKLSENYVLKYQNEKD